MSEMVEEVDRAVSAGMSVINGLHEQLGPRYPDLPEGQWIWDIRQEPKDLGIAWARAAKLSNRRALLVAPIFRIQSGREVISVSGF